MKSKKILLIFTLILATILTTSFIFVKASGVESSDPKTPNGTLVPYQVVSTELTSTEKYKYISDEQKYIDDGAIRLDEPTTRYNSHSYAWYNQYYETNNYTISNINVMKYFQDGSYDESSGNEGDIICYWRIRLEYNDLTKSELISGTPYLAHSGIITSINEVFDPDDLDTLENITVVSKWGKGGLFEHSGNNNPYYYDSIHGSGNAIDTLHFENVNLSYIDDALFYVKVYTPKIDDTTNVNNSLIPYIFEKTIDAGEYALYKLNILDSGTYNFKTVSSSSTDIRIYNHNMNLLYDQEVNTSSISYINTSVSAGIYYMRVAFKNTATSGIVTTIIEGVSDSSDTDSGILVDSQFAGSEVYLNNGVVGGNTITEGFTRYLFLNPTIATSSSRLEYDWYSSNPGKATVTQYGTVLAKNGAGNPEVTITAIHKNDRSIVFTKTFTILDETKTQAANPIYVYGSMTVERGKATLIVLPDDAPYNFNQYYAWSTGGNNSISVSNYGTITSYTSGIYTVTGTYTYNRRVKVIMTIIVQ